MKYYKRYIPSTNKQDFVIFKEDKDKTNNIIPIFCNDCRVYAGWRRSIQLGRTRSKLIYDCTLLQITEEEVIMEML